MDVIHYGPIGIFSLEKPLTREKLKEYLAYDINTGIFSWVERKGMRKPVGSEAGWVHPKGYRYIEFDGCAYFAHRLAFLYVLNRVPEQVDHKDRTKDNNRWLNLLPANNSTNQRNTGIRKTNTSGYKGVSYNKQKSKWIARITFRGVDTYIGAYQTREAAALARELKEKELNIITWSDLTLPPINLYTLPN